MQFTFPTTVAVREREQSEYHGLKAHREMEIRAAALDSAARVLASITGEHDVARMGHESVRDRTLEMARMFEQYIEHVTVPSEDSGSYSLANR